MTRRYKHRSHIGDLSYLNDVPSISDVDAEKCIGIRESECDEAAMDLVIKAAMQEIRKHHAAHVPNPHGVTTGRTGLMVLPFPMPVLRGGVTERNS